METGRRHGWSHLSPAFQGRLSGSGVFGLNPARVGNGEEGAPMALIEGELPGGAEPGRPCGKGVSVAVDRSTTLVG